MPIVTPTSVPASSVTKLKASKSRQKFLQVFPIVQNELLEYLEQQGMPADAKEWYKKNLEYNAPGGKLNRGLSVVDTAEILMGRPMNDDEYLRAAILGWCVELLQAYFLVADDIMDASITRRGQKCWYKVDGVSTIAINDSFMLEAAIYHLLKKHFRSEPYYVNLLELFLDTTFKTEMGQLIDLITAPEDHVDLNRFSLEKHQLIVVYKTAFYSFYLPVALAMYMCGITDDSAYQLASSILIPLGEYFQVQDDYLDCYGNPEMIGKIGTDILDNKCSWNVNVALNSATPEQRRILEENYGRKNSEAETRVKAVFDEIDIPGRYAEYEQKTYERLCRLIDSIPETESSTGECTLKREVFSSFLEKIYKRTK